MAPVLEARRYSIGEALVAAGAPLTEAQAMNGNRSKTVQRATRETHPPNGITAAAWLEERGWTPLGREWIPPSTMILD